MEDDSDSENCNSVIVSEVEYDTDTDKTEFDLPPPQKSRKLAGVLYTKLVSIQFGLNNFLLLVLCHVIVIGRLNI